MAPTSPWRVNSRPRVAQVGQECYTGPVKQPINPKNPGRGTRKTADVKRLQYGRR